ncbi:amidohydrolase family protein [Microbacterium sp. BWT-B31]|uniref:amidohydrolase n=1 Tax=Microbacterium sp. BWT-B31 TaxID=3232072 RepID=UPI003528E62E
MRDYIGPATEVVALAGQTVTPGLIDGHLHPLQGLELTLGVDLGGITTAQALLAALREEANRAIAEDSDPWVRGWNVAYDVFRELPLTAAAIDGAVLGLPTLLILFDGHTALASTEGLRRGGITRARELADTGVIVTDSGGVPTGELREMSAYEPVRLASPAVPRAEVLRKARALLWELRSSGLTGGCIMDGGAATLDLLTELDGGPGLPVRLVTAIDHEPGFDEERTLANLALRDNSGKRWRSGLVKLYADGVVETGTSWLFDQDAAGGGIEPFWRDMEAYARTVSRYASAGFQVATHAIGDRAVASVIDAYVRVGSLSRSGAPHRIEHLETMADRDVARLAATGITASMQPLHMQHRSADASDEWSRRLGPARAARAWRAGDLWRVGAPVALGSDWPIAQNDARIGLAWAMLRRRPGDVHAPVFEAEQRLTAYQALHGYTIGSALAQGDSDLGIIAPGARADYAVWAADPLAVTGDELAQTPVFSILGGDLSERPSP